MAQRETILTRIAAVKRMLALEKQAAHLAI